MQHTVNAIFFVERWFKLVDLNKKAAGIMLRLGYY